MILQEEFRQHGYTDLLAVKDASEYGIDLVDLYDEKPDELLGIYISEHRDELFFLLDVDSGDINDLCDRWDDRIRTFTLINGNNPSVKELKYNIVQMIVYSGETPDKNREGNLMITRKIIIKGNTADKAHIEIDAEEAIELPFHMIPADTFAPDEEQERRLHQLIPEEAGLLAITQKKVVRKKRLERDGVLIKSMDSEDFEKIRRWLE